MMTQMDEMEENMLFSSSLLSPTLYPHIQEGEKKETKQRRRRKKAKAEDGEAKKRRLTDEQVEFLEMNFCKERKLESGRKIQLAAKLGLDPKQVAIWFQNRRARGKNKHMEEEYMRLKAMHDIIVVEKCHLETEVLKLKERLLESEEALRKLSGSSNGASGAEASGSPSSSFSTATEQPLRNEFSLEEGIEMLYVNEYDYMEWGNFYGM